jgi:hypothetical protein
VAKLERAKKVTLGASGLCWVIANVDGIEHSFVLPTEARPTWTSGSLADIGVDDSDSRSEDDDEDGDDGDYDDHDGVDDDGNRGDSRDGDSHLAGASAAAVRHVRRLTVTQLRQELADRGRVTGGTKAELAIRLAQALEPEFVEQRELRRRRAARLRAESVARPNDLFFDVEAPTAGNGETYPVDAVLERLGSLAEWPRSQVDADASGHGVRHTGSDLLLYMPPGRHPRVVVPEQHRAAVLKLVHDELGHNTTCTEREVKRAFYWPRLKADVQQFLKTCPDCLRTKKYIIAHHKLRRAAAYYCPREAYSLDIKQVTAHGEATFALAIVDRFSGWATVVRMNDKTTSSVLAAINTHIRWKHGPIKQISIDAASQFVSKQFDDWANSAGIEVVRTTPLETVWSRDTGGTTMRAWRHCRSTQATRKLITGSPGSGTFNTNEVRVCPLSKSCMVRLLSPPR